MIAIDINYANQSCPDFQKAKDGISRFYQTQKMPNKSDSRANEQLKQSHKRAFSDFRALKSQETQNRALSSATKQSTNFNTTQ
jgi:hypothetical protein